VVGFTTGSRGEVKGEERIPVTRNDDDDKSPPIYN
jgi:hypothetical protein